MKREQLNATVPCALASTMASFIQRAEEVGITAWISTSSFPLVGEPMLTPPSSSERLACLSIAATALSLLLEVGACFCFSRRCRLLPPSQHLSGLLDDLLQALDLLIVVQGVHRMHIPAEYVHVGLQKGCDLARIIAFQQ